MSGRSRFSFTCNSGWGCYLLVVCHGVVFQFGEHLFHSWGCDNYWWDNHWRHNHWWDPHSSLPLEIPINFATVRPKIFSGYFGNFPSAPKSLQDIFGTFPSAPESFQDIFGSVSSALEIFSGYFGQYDFLIQLSQTNFHLLEFVCGHKSSSALVIRPLDSNCGFCLSCAVFEQLSQLLS